MPGAGVLLAVPALAMSRQDRPSLAFVPHGAAQAAAGISASFEALPLISVPGFGLATTRMAIFIQLAVKLQPHSDFRSADIGDRLPAGRDQISPQMKETK